MKYLLRTFCLMGMVACSLFCAAATVTLTFTGRTTGDRYNRLDSVIIENLTKEWSETLDCSVDTTYVLTVPDAPTSLETIEAIQNVLTVNLAHSDRVNIRVMDILGSVVLDQTEQLSAGQHHLDLPLNPKQVYVLVVRSSSGSISTKLINGCAAKAKAKANTSTGYQMRYTGFTSQFGMTVRSETIQQFQSADELITLCFKPVPVFTYTATEKLQDIDYAFDEQIAMHSFQDGVGAILFYRNVHRIKDYAFDGRTELTGVTLPECLHEIGFMSFRNCTNLKSVDMSDSVTVIENFAFFHCYQLKDITLPPQLTEISIRAFDNCTSLTRLDLPEGIVTIHDYAFSGCSGLTEFTIPANVTTIGMRAFWACTGLQQVTNLSATPQTTDTGVYSPFYEVDLSACTLYVPETSLEAYRQSLVWKDFGTILPVTVE